jgi:hypothetical protein
VRGEICPVCCAESRETTVDCPIDCRYLRDAHEYERAPEPDPERYPHPDIDITERFAGENSTLFAFLGRTLATIALDSPRVNDNDFREALDALTRTYRTLESGLVYETRPANPLAAAIQQQVTEQLDEVRRRLREQTGLDTLRDADVLGVLVAFQRLEYGRNNGRPRSRAFLDFLCREFAADEAAPPGGNVIVA